MFSLKFSTTDQIVFTKRLSFMLSAGISLSQALRIIHSQSRKKIQAITSHIVIEIEKGRSLSESLAQFPDSFPFYVQKIIKAGEESGLLTENLQAIAKEIHRRKTLKRKIVSSLVYPMLIAVGTIFLSFFLIFFIFPKITSLFQGLHATLPLSTRVIMAASNILRSYWMVFLLFFILNSYLISFSLKKYPQAREYRDALLLNLPLINSIIKMYILSHIFKTISMMLKAHIPIHKTLNYTAESVSHTDYHNAMTTIVLAINNGKTLSQSLATKKNLFPDMAIQLIEVGETSGTLADTLLYISELYDQEIEESLKVIVSIIEPLLMILMGLVVGFIALSIITPVYEITQNINH